MQFIGLKDIIDISGNFRKCLHFLKRIFEIRVVVYFVTNLKLGNVELVVEKP